MRIFFILLNTVLVYSLNKKIIWDQTQTRESLIHKVNLFNDWANFIITNNSLKIDFIDNLSNKLGVYSKTDYLLNNTKIFIDDIHILSIDKIYNTGNKYSPFIKEIEEKYGYDEISYFTILLISEYFDSKSQFRLFLDLLPFQPFTPVYNYWEISEKIEPEIMGTSLIRKLVDYKIFTENRARNIFYGLFSLNNSLFDEEIFNIENVEWAIYIYDILLENLEDRIFLSPFLFHFQISSNGGNLLLKFEENKLEINFDNNQNQNILSKRKKISGDNLLIYYGVSIEDNEENDCLSLGLTFSERIDDKFVQERIRFFEKFYLFDRNHFDLIEECVNINNFSRRILFYFYTSLMDLNELNKTNPKRINLEEDKIIINYGYNYLKELEKRNSKDLQKEIEEIIIESDTLIKTIKKYKLQQRKLLIKYIEKFRIQYNFLIRDEEL